MNAKRTVTYVLAAVAAALALEGAFLGAYWFHFGREGRRRG